MKESRTSGGKSGFLAVSVIFEMRKYFLIVIAAVMGIAPHVILAASFERDLFFGLSNDAEVIRLQEFLRDQGIYKGPVTGGFFALTREAVKKFQQEKDILPAAGYFGPKTRAIVNAVLGKAPAVSREQEIVQLQESIRLLQARLKELQEQEKKELALLAAPSPTPSVTPMPAAASLPSAVAPQVATTPAVSPRPSQFEVKGTNEAEFPPTAVSPLKLGDITIVNNLGSDVPLSQVVMRVTDLMNSPANRNREVLFILRKGTTTSSEMISKTALRFSSIAPSAGGHRYEVRLPYPLVLRSGEETTAGLWVEDLDYVIGGTLGFQLDTLLATVPLSPSGTFHFTLSR